MSREESNAFDLSKLDELYEECIDFIKDALPLFHTLKEQENELTVVLMDWIARSVPEENAKKITIEMVSECLQSCAGEFTQDAEKVIESYRDFKTFLSKGNLDQLSEENFLYQVWSGDINKETEMAGINELRKDVQDSRESFSKEMLSKIALKTLIKEYAPKFKRVKSG